MSQRPNQFGQQSQQTGQRQDQMNLDQWTRDPATGQFLTREEQAYVRQLAQQYPQQVQQAYARNVPFSAVGLNVPRNLGNRGQQIGQETGPRTGAQGMSQQRQMPRQTPQQRPQGQQMQQPQGFQQQSGNQW